MSLKTLCLNGFLNGFLMVPFKKQIFKWFFNGFLCFFNGFLNGRFWGPLVVASRTSTKLFIKK